MTTPFASDLELARAAAGGDGVAWNEVVARYGDRILAASMTWCEGGCRIPRGDYDCILRTIRAQRPEPGETPEGCREGIALYRHATEQLKARLGEFDETSSLDAFVLATLAEVREAYMHDERGRLTMPTALGPASPLARDVFKLSCREASRAEVARRLGVDEGEVRGAESEIRGAFASAGLTWWGLQPQDAAAPEVAPAWVHRAVMAGGDAPEPARPNDSIARKALSQPGWLAGVVIGAAISALCLLVVIPREQYAKSVREPADVLLADASKPLPAPLDVRLEGARTNLRAGRVDAAVQDLNALLALRPDNQEARWLLAQTYDQLGDRANAARHYKLFLDLDGRLRAATDDRVKRAQARLGRFEEIP